MGTPEPPESVLEFCDAYFSKLYAEAARWAGFCADEVSNEYDFVLVFIAALVTVDDPEVAGFDRQTDRPDQLGSLEPYLREVHAGVPEIVHVFGASADLDQWLSACMESLFQWIERHAESIHPDAAVNDPDWRLALPDWIEPSVQEHLQCIWNEDKNARRCELIDKVVDDGPSRSEEVELAFLQCAVDRHLDRIAPMPMQKFEEFRRRLHLDTDTEGDSTRDD